MMHRLLWHQEQQVSAYSAEISEEKAAEDDSSSESAAEQVDFGELGMLELREECRKHGLAQYGTKKGAIVLCLAASPVVTHILTYELFANFVPNTILLRVQTWSDRGTV